LRDHLLLDGGGNRTEQCFAVSEVAVCGIRRNPNPARRFPNGERVWTPGLGERETGVNQCRAQVSMVVTGQPLTLLGSEVYGVNITNVDGVNMATEDLG
jgi:hypothetical protein